MQAHALLKDFWSLGPFVTANLDSRALLRMTARERREEESSVSAGVENVVTAKVETGLEHA